MSHFLINGNTYRIFADDALNLRRELPVGTYIIQINPQTGEYYLETVAQMKNPKKLYGNTLKHTERIMNTFNSRPNSTGVMLAGLRGSGKTLLARNLSIKGAELGLPTLLINTPLCGENFNRFIQKIEQPAVVIFDEFEKIYEPEQQEQILTLLDGVFPSKKLFVFTCNDKWKVDINMRNRPGRIYYMLNFTTLDEAFIREYCEDNLNNKSHIDAVVRVSSVFTNYNFDMLQALVEEMNRYDESPADALQMLNSKPEFEEDQQYDVTIIEMATGRQLQKNEYYPTRVRGNPLTSRFAVEIILPSKNNDKKDEDDDLLSASNTVDVNLSGSNLTNIDNVNRSYSFVESGYNIMLKREAEKNYTFIDY